MNVQPYETIRYKALLQLLRTADVIWDASRTFFSRWDLGPSQFNVLNLLYGNEQGVSQTGLSRELIMHRSNITGLVDRLEARGLVQRKDEKSDRRAYRVVLTPAGEQLIKEILPSAQPHVPQHGLRDWAGGRHRVPAGQSGPDPVF